jgi:GPH family glycoside/pentoside/hexuronide:cation symporter
VSSESGKLTVIQKSGYALGIHGIMYFWYATNLYLFYFYTDVVGLTPAQTGTVFLLSLIWDGITDPVMGAIVDRLIARGWKYRPMVLLGGIPFCLSFAALFYVPAGVEVFAYCLVANLVFRTFFTLTYIPYTSMLTRITQDSRERSNIGGYKSIFIGISKLPVSYFALPLIAVLGAGNEALGFIKTMSLLAVMGGLAFVGCYLLTPEPASATPAGRSRAHSLAEVVAYFRANSQFWVVAASLFLASGSFGIIMQSVIYYYKYNLNSPGAAKIAFTAIAVASLVGVPIWMQILRIASNRIIWFSGCCLAAVMLLTIYLLPEPGVWVIAVLIGFAAAGIYAFIMTFLPMIADTVDYGQSKSGLRIEAFTFGFVSLVNKLSIGTAGWLLGTMQTWVGFVPNAEQSATTLQGLKVIITLVPMLGLVLSAIVILKYRIDAKYHAKLVDEIQQQRG